MIDEKVLIEEFKSMLNTMVVDADGTHAVSLEAVIAFIEMFPTIQPQGINKDRLIMAIANWQMTLKPSWKSQADTVIYNTLEEVCELINQQPTSDGWIPVSSGAVPTKEDYSEDGFVLVQTGGDIIYKGFYDVESGFWADEAGFKFAYLPIAWQPLPPAYKEIKDVF